MDKYIEILEKCALFAGMKAPEIRGMLHCLGAKVSTFQKNAIVFQEGEPAKNVGIVLSGSVQVIREDYYGNRSVLAVIERGQLFGEVFACAETEFLPVSVVTVSDCEIMLLDCQRITKSCSNACEFHSRIIFNLMHIVANKNILMNQKIEIMSKRTTREKLMAYFMLQAKQQGSNSFTIPYDRQALADYIGAERSAMSAELSKLQKDGILEYRKNYFKLL